METSGRNLSLRKPFDTYTDMKLYSSIHENKNVYLSVHALSLQISTLSTKFPIKDCATFTIKILLKPKMFSKYFLPSNPHFSFIFEFSYKQK